jgi:hypothetical protein
MTLSRRLLSNSDVRAVTGKRRNLGRQATQRERQLSQYLRSKYDGRLPAILRRWLGAGANTGRHGLVLGAFCKDAGKAPSAPPLSST